MLSIMFNPEDLLLSTIISIPKDNRGSMNYSDNYRGISLSNSICKLYDYVFIHLNMDYLKTVDMQFGFKKIIQLFYILLYILRLLITI